MINARGAYLEMSPHSGRIVLNYYVTEPTTKLIKTEDVINFIELDTDKNLLAHGESGEVYLLVEGELEII